MSRPIFPFVRQRAPVLDFFRERKGFTAGTLTESQRQMAEEFRRGIATGLGVPPEAIREEPVQRWIVSYTRAFVKPEYWAEVAPTVGVIRDLGRQIGEIIRSALSAKERLELMKQAQPPLAEQPQRAREEPQRTEEEPPRVREEPFSSSLSVVKI